MTDRTLTAGVVTETTAEVIKSVGFIELLFDTDPVRVWTGIGTYPATMPGESAQNWLGVGDLGSIDGILESENRSRNGVRLIMSGIDNDLLVNALTQDYQGRSAKIWHSFLDDNLDIVPDPTLVFAGEMDVMEAIEGDTQGAIVVQCESRESTLQKNSESLLTDEEQQRLFPGDLGLQFVQALQSKEIVWGESEPVRYSRSKGEKSRRYNY